ncbi:MAG TPA: hypothetical protein VGD64_15585 [Acidisarcina sp.]
MESIRGFCCEVWRALRLSPLPAAWSTSGLCVAMVVASLALQGCGVKNLPSANNQADILILISPQSETLAADGVQQFSASVTGAANNSVIWSVSGAGATGGYGSITASGLYTAPPSISAAVTVNVRATSVADPSKSAFVAVVLQPAAITVIPATASVPAGTRLSFTANVTGLNNPALRWTIDGAGAGDRISGTVTAAGVYTAPSISPGTNVTLTAVSAVDATISANATVTVTNPPALALTGATYADELTSWNAVMLPWIEDLCGLEWDPVARVWSAVPGWSPPPSGIGPQIYYLEPALRPLTHMAVMRGDVAVMDQLASFHLALLSLRTTTIGAMLDAAPANAILFIDGPPAARTFAWYEPAGPGQVRVRECQQCDAQYISTASRLVRAIAEMPASQRTSSLTAFAQTFSSFIASEQLMRLLYGATPWSHWDNPNIPQPVVAGWQFLAATGYEPPAPIRYQASMTDIELWMIADAADMISADQSAPQLAILDNNTRVQLKEAVKAGVALMQARCHHEVSPDGADVLSAFAGDSDGHPDLAYSAYTTIQQPTVPSAKAGLSWDSSHSYRLPLVFRTLYETRAATGNSYPALDDLVALGNTYVHLAFNGDASMPDFNNFIDGWNGWLRVGYSDIPGGYPPHQYCAAAQSPNNCLTAGTLQGWGQLAFANPDLAALEQHVIDLAYDDSAQAMLFKDQHYFYNGGHYSVVASQYPWLMVYVAGDSAERLP